MRKPFEKGERVAVYDGPNRFTGEVAETTGPGFPGSVCVLFRVRNWHGKHLFHENQLRRLKPKRKPREFWSFVKEGGSVCFVKTGTGYQVTESEVEARESMEDLKKQFPQHSYRLIKLREEVL